MLKVTRFRALKKEPLQFNMEEYYNFIHREMGDTVEKILKADLAFQASFETRWDKLGMSKYVTNLFLNMSPSTFVFADVESCLEAAQEDGRATDEKYFESWKNQVCKFLNIDSNNRNIIIEKFIKGEVPLLNGLYEMESGTYTITDHNNTFDKLPDGMVKEFWNTDVIVTVYTDATREELSELFKAINDGQPLNNPEKLNAETSEVASKVRELAKRHSKFFTEDTSWFNSNQVIRRGIDDFIAGTLFHYYHGWTSAISKGNLMSMYRVDSPEHTQLSRFVTNFNKFINWLPNDVKGISNRNSIFDLFFVWKEYVVVRKLKFKDGDVSSKFIKEYIKVVSDLLKSNKTYKFANLKDPKSFETMVGGRQLSNNKMRNELIMKKMDKIIGEFTVKLDSKRGYTNTDKMVMAARDNFKTPEGKNIELSKLLTNKYHGGHKKAHTMGGETTLDNGVIQTAEDNWETGIEELK